MCAALATVTDRTPHSCHAYFLRPGNPDLAIEYDVDRIRDGRSFTTRRVVARQDGVAIFNLAMSCHVPEPGDSHQFDLEIPPEPSGEPHEEGIRRGLHGLGIEVAAAEFGFGAFELLIEGGLDMAAAPTREARLGTWLRARGRVPDGPGLHAALLAYISDLTIMIPAYHPLDFGPMSPGAQSASLDHAIWFHAPFRVDEWIYAVQDSPVTHGARGLGRALFYTRDGRLVASAVQEGLIRYQRPE
jgi:acyl-CoA thioesterase-2